MTSRCALSATLYPLKYAPFTVVLFETASHNFRFPTSITFVLFWVGGIWSYFCRLTWWRSVVLHDIFICSSLTRLAKGFAAYQLVSQLLSRLIYQKNSQEDDGILSCVAWLLEAFKLLQPDRVASLLRVKERCRWRNASSFNHLWAL